MVILTKLERQLLKIINENPYGWTQVEIVGHYVERHLGPALLTLQRERRVTLLDSNYGPRLAPVRKRRQEH